MLQQSSVESRKSSVTPPRQRVTSRNTSRTSLQDSLRDSAMPEISPEVPERVVALVQEMLGAMQRRNSLANACPESAPPAPEKAKTAVLNIWDFAGQAVYYTTHQVAGRGYDERGRGSGV